ncbi:MAG: 4-alpha-glucanotransferase [Chlamydiae bacterium]|nr:4-alpha-glucanotransferase [Chlamydiota bacterium]
MGKRTAGVNIPVFSLRTKKSLGVGEFYDLIPLIDWAKEAGLKLIQILPINDTSMTETKSDGYPYSILSAFALHPLYLNIQALAPELEDEIIKPFVKKLNLPHFDYGRTYLAKKELLRMLFIMRGEKDLRTKAFEQFFKRNESNLRAYAAFCTMRDMHQTSDFRKWGQFSKYSELLVDDICEKYDVTFFYFVQYHLDKQLREVVAHAHKQKILLKGDFPMGVHPHSVEAWRFFEYFRWGKSMGAPPDFYNNLGQNWGFPPYDWDEIKEEGFFWLKSRLKWMEQYFDAVRLDHVLGYFRLWEVPIEEVRGLMGNFFPAEGYTKEELAKVGLTEPFGAPLPKGLETQRKVKAKIKDPKQRDKLYTQIENRLFFKREGSYHPRIDLKSTETFQALGKEMQDSVLQLFDHYYLERQEALWRKKGIEKLKFMQNHTSMLICAEDIGVIPKCVGEVLKELKMLNLYVQRMPKSFELEYEDPQDFPEMCVCTPSNHDTATLREWWEEDEESTMRYYHTILKHSGTPPKQLSETLARQIIQMHLNSKARFAIFLLQDLLAMSDALKFPDPSFVRINDPAKPDNQWEWRMHLYVEELLLAKSFTKLIRQMVDKGKR